MKGKNPEVFQLFLFMRNDFEWQARAWGAAWLDARALGSPQEPRGRRSGYRGAACSLTRRWHVENGFPGFCEDQECRTICHPKLNSIFFLHFKCFSPTSVSINSLHIMK